MEKDKIFKINRKVGDTVVSEYILLDYVYCVQQKDSNGKKDLEIYTKDGGIFFVDNEQADSFMQAWLEYLL